MKKREKLQAILGPETSLDARLYQESTVTGRSAEEILLGAVGHDTGKRRYVPEQVVVDRASLGGGGWPSTSMARAFREWGGGSLGIISNYTDNWGCSRLLSDSALCAWDLHIPPLGDPAGLISWMLAEWEATPFADITRSGAKMALLYGQRVTGDSFEPVLLKRLRTIEQDIRSGRFCRPPDWLFFCSTMVDLAELLDRRFFGPRHGAMRGASVQNLVLFAYLLHTIGWDPAAGNPETALTADEDIFESLLDWLGVDDVRLAYASLGPACLVAVLEGAVIKVGDDAVLVGPSEGGRHLANQVRRDPVTGRFLTTRLDEPGRSLVLDERGVSLVVGGHECVLRAIHGSAVEFHINGECLSLREGRRGETIVDAGDGRRRPTPTDSTWLRVKVGDTRLEVMGRRIEGQYFITMEPHLSRVGDMTLCALSPRLRPDGRLMINGDGRIDYDVSENSAEATATALAVAILRGARRAVRMDGGAPLTTQLSHLLTPGIASSIASRRDIPRVYVAPTTRDLEASGLSLRECTEVMERSITRAIGLEFHFEQLFDYVVLPFIPRERLDEYTSQVRADGCRFLNDRGLQALEEATMLVDVIEVFRNDDFLSSATKRKINVEKTLKRFKIVPTEPLTVTDDDQAFFRDRRVRIEAVDTSEDFGIWEKKIVYEPRRLRDRLLSLEPKA